MFWFILQAVIWDTRLRATQPVLWARLHAERGESLRSSYFWTGWMGFWLLVALATYEGTIGDAINVVFLAWLLLTEALQLYFAYQDEHDDKDQDGDNYAWVH